MSYYGSNPSASTGERDGGSGGFYGNNNNGGGGYPPMSSFPSQQQQQHPTAMGPYGVADASQWQSQAPSQQQQQQQQQQFGYNNAGYNNNPGYYNTNMQPNSGGGSMFNSPAAMATVGMLMAGGGMNQFSDGSSAAMMQQLGTQVGLNMWKSSTARMIPGLESAFLMLRPYFAVDNGYIVTKMKKILFPFRSQNWARQLKEDVGPQSGMAPQYNLPTVDDNAPDLYLPCMSMITYVLLCAFLFGTAGQFDPEFIPDVTTQCVVIQLLETALVRFGYYLMQVPVAMLDLWSWTGYKYTGLCVSMCFGLLGGLLLGGSWGSRGFYIAFFYTASAMAYFTLQTYSHNIPMHTAHGGPKREFVIMAFAAMPFLTMWLMSKTKLL